uniref:Sulfatase domain-containing protein n=2 Tax=Rhodnius prolixus TaxID=13249 RepID=T1I2L4_RHOPR
MYTNHLVKAVLTQLLFIYIAVECVSDRPNIVFIVADDLGWNDVGFHGSSQIATPNIDALAYSGIILNNYYVSPLCTPSRSAIMTGKHPIHTGMQHSILYGAEPRGLPLSEKLLPEYLRELGYKTHAVGKWHLGSYKKEFTPTFRGFDSHFGFWTGHQDYNDHTAMETGMWGLDLRRNMTAATEEHGRYSTDIFTDEAVRIIEEHPVINQPLFLYMAHAAVHSGNPYNPLPVPDTVVVSITNITDYYRRRFAGMLVKLDQSVGKIVDALYRRDLLHNTVIVFTTDNGGPAAGFNLNAASNWPLRGVKNTLWEGGVRGAALVWSPLLKNSSRVSNQMIHISDWLPTLLSAAKAKHRIPEGLDGLDLWNSLSHGTLSHRSFILHNIDDIDNNSALTIGHWKIVRGTTYQGSWDGWYGPSGRSDGRVYDVDGVIKSTAGQAIVPFTKALIPETILNLRDEAEIKCNFSKQPQRACLPLKMPCLFNIKEDPCELNNVAPIYPDLTKRLLEELSKLNETALPAGNLPIDQRGNPKFWNNIWTNFGDYPVTSND